MNEEKPKKETLWYVGADYDYRNKAGAPRQSDKVYVVELYPDGTNIRNQSTWAVKASWGRRGKRFQSQIKQTGASYWLAMSTFEELVFEKIAKGYKKWEFVVAEEEMHTMTDWNS